MMHILLAVIISIYSCFSFATRSSSFKIDSVERRDKYTILVDLNQFNAKTNNDAFSFTYFISEFDYKENNVTESKTTLYKKSDNTIIESISAKNSFDKEKKRYKCSGKIFSPREKDLEYKSSYEFRIVEEVDGKSVYEIEGNLPELMINDWTLLKSESKSDSNIPIYTVKLENRDYDNIVIKTIESKGGIELAASYNSITLNRGKFININFNEKQASQGDASIKVFYSVNNNNASIVMHLKKGEEEAVNEALDGNTKKTISSRVVVSGLAMIGGIIKLREKNVVLQQENDFLTQLRGRQETDLQQKDETITQLKQNYLQKQNNITTQSNQNLKKKDDALEIKNAIIKIQLKCMQLHTQGSNDITNAAEIVANIRLTCPKHYDAALIIENKAKNSLVKLDNQILFLINEIISSNGDKLIYTICNPFDEKMQQIFDEIKAYLNLLKKLNGMVCSDGPIDFDNFTDGCKLQKEELCVIKTELDKAQEIQAKKLVTEKDKKEKKEKEKEKRIAEASQKDEKIKELEFKFKLKQLSEAKVQQEQIVKQKIEITEQETQTDALFSLSILCEQELNQYSPENITSSQLLLSSSGILCDLDQVKNAIKTPLELVLSQLSASNSVMLWDLNQEEEEVIQTPLELTSSQLLTSNSIILYNPYRAIEAVQSPLRQARSQPSSSRSIIFYNSELTKTAAQNQGNGSIDLALSSLTRKNKLE